MGSVRVVIHTAEEGCRRVLANHLDQEMRATGVLVDEVRHVVDEAGDQDKRALLGLFLDCVDSGKFGKAKRYKAVYVQLSQLMTGRSSLLLGQAKVSCVSLSFFSCIVSWPLRISLGGNVCHRT